MLANENINLPTKPMTLKKLDQINKLIGHHFTSAEIDEKIRRQNGLIDMVNRVAERREIQERRRLALVRNDEEAVQACNDELAALVPMKLAYGTSLTRPVTQPAVPGVKKEQERLAEINRRNQQLNAENIRKAQLAENKIRRIRAPVPTSTTTQPSDTATQSTDKDLLKPPTKSVTDDDLFGSSDRSRAATPSATGTGTNTPAKTAISTPDLVASIPVVKTALGNATANGEKPKNKAGYGFFGAARRKREEEEAAILAKLDFDIDIDI